jgi:hypothetical protein
MKIKKEERNKRNGHAITRSMYEYITVKFEVFTAVNIKIVVSWNTMVCKLHL